MFLPEEMNDIRYYFKTVFMSCMVWNIVDAANSIWWWEAMSSNFLQTAGLFKNRIRNPELGLLVGLYVLYSKLYCIPISVLPKNVFIVPNNVCCLLYSTTNRCIVTWWVYCNIMHVWTWFGMRLYVHACSALLEKKKTCQLLFILFNDNQALLVNH